MTVTRPASAHGGRTWAGRRWRAASAPPRPRTSRQRPGARAASTSARTVAAAVVLAGLAAAAVPERAALAASVGVLGQLRWLGIPAAIMLESASMAAFAIMLRRLLAAGGTSVGIRPMLATTYAANALSVSVPLAGPELATAFTFRRFSRQGADAPLAGWSLLAGGVVSTAAAALVVVGGGLASGNILVTAVAVPGGLLAVAALVLIAAATRRPRLRGALERPAAWTWQHASRVLRGPPTIRARSSRPGPSASIRSGFPRRAGWR